MIHDSACPSMSHRAVIKCVWYVCAYTQRTMPKMTNTQTDRQTRLTTQQSSQCMLLSLATVPVASDAPNVVHSQYFRAELENKELQCNYKIHTKYNKNTQIINYI